jgi:hypothetical protein
LTLKLKIRAKDAPVETAKFMGHGVCDSISRSTTLCSATRDTKIVEKEVQILLKQLKGSTLYTLSYTNRIILTHLNYSLQLIAASCGEWAFSLVNL